jgi:hypothetical protein
MTSSRPGPPQWPLSNQNQTTRSAHAPRAAGAPPNAPSFGQPTAPPYSRPAPTRHGDPRHRPAGPGPHPAGPQNGPRHATGEWRTVPGARPTPPTTPGRRHGRRADASPWHWLLLIPIVVPLSPAIYNRIEPTFIGMPFFYWGQLSFAFLASAVIAFVHRKVK